MEFCCYILHSPELDKYYVGSTHDLDSRLQKHNSGYYSKAFSKRAADWEVFLVIPCQDEGQSRRIELHIKKMKSRKYYQSLKTVPGLLDRLLDRYK
ncbi:MAG TPA: endonuclease [Cytophagales bacterium]|nr:endonuclease [Cytophagales bacterium]